ncbi:MAG TPA: hypothetical protein VK137_12325, partial [Planctomycetaceae bacterium]|nr:hypothetical protein [Planctomycetaceae bacterium]
MSRQPSNMRCQWARVHHLKAPATVCFVVPQKSCLAATGATASSASVPQFSLESRLVRFLMSTSLFLHRATWFALFAVLPLLGQVSVLSAADVVFAPPAAADVRTKVMQWVVERN